MFIIFIFLFKTKYFIELNIVISEISNTNLRTVRDQLENYKEIDLIQFKAIEDLTKQIQKKEVELVRRPLFPSSSRF